MIDYKNIPFINARWFQETGAEGRGIQVICLHTMEAPEKPGTARGVAHYFADLDRKASAHYCIDDQEIIQCVQCKDVAYAAPNANRMGIHLELAGYAAQTANDWQDPYSQSVLKNAAQLCAQVLIPKYKIEPLYLAAAVLKDLRWNRSKTGFTTHHDVTLGLNGGKGHTDPGPNFPMSQFLGYVKAAL